MAIWIRTRTRTRIGRITILAFGAEQRFIEESASRADENHVYSFATLATDRWITFYLDLLGNLIVLSASLLAVATRTSITGGLTGLSLSYALQVRLLSDSLPFHIIYQIFLNLLCYC